MKFKGICLFERTNSKTLFIIAAYHHPKSITWRWALYLDIKKDKFKFHFWKNAYLNPRFVIGFKYFGIELQTQDHMWRNS